MAFESSPHQAIAPLLTDLLEHAAPEGSVLLMRHGPRDPIIDAPRAEEAMLTAEGVRQTRRLGAEVIGRRPPDHLFHSTVPRCGQTVEALLEGLAESGKGPPPRNHGPQPDLAAPFLPDRIKTYVWAKENGLDSNAFFQRWCGGRVDRALADDPREGARMTLAFLGRMQRRHGGFQVHVSHDWNILLLAWAYLGVAPTPENWPGFLEGILVAFEPGRARLRFRDREGSTPTP